MELNGGKYTWSNNRFDPTLERLDRVLINDKWEKEFSLTNLMRKAPREMSDHNPLMLCTDWGVKMNLDPFALRLLGFDIMSSYQKSELSGRNRLLLEMLWRCGTLKSRELKNF